MPEPPFKKPRSEHPSVSSCSTLLKRSVAAPGGNVSETVSPKPQVLSKSTSAGGSAAPPSRFGRVATAKPPSKAQLAEEQRRAAENARLLAKVSELATEEEKLQRRLCLLQHLVDVAEPNAIEELIDRQQQERQKLLSAPDALRTDEELAALDAEHQRIAGLIVARQTERAELVAEVDALQDAVQAAKETLVVECSALDDLLPELTSAQAEATNWCEELQRHQCVLTQEQNASFGVSSEAAELLQESERLINSRKRIVFEAAATEIERRRVFALYEELKGTIRVYCRVKDGSGSHTLETEVKPRDPSPVSARGPLSVVETANEIPPTQSLPRPSSSSTLCGSEIACSSCGTGGAKFSFPDATSENDITGSTAGKKLHVVTTRDNATSTGKREMLVAHEYDCVFPPQASQSRIFDEVGPLVDCAVDGYRVCILAYGQTGSGKTYTMEGDIKSEAHMGITPRAIRRVFERKAALAADGWKYRITCFFVEIYNDSIRDLLEPSEAYHRAFTIEGSGAGRQHEIVHKGRHDTCIKEVTERQAHSTDDVLKLLDVAVGNRSVAKTAMNERSSRSHCVFTIRIEGQHDGLKQKSLGNLCLVDLAGSERVHESGVQGAQMKEAVNINRSLSFLGDCICALGSAGAAVPWRNCKLTLLLQNYLGGEGAKVLMLVTVSDKEEHLPETLNSLRFAAKVNQTSIGAGKRRVVGYGAAAGGSQAPDGAGVSVSASR